MPEYLYRPGLLVSGPNPILPGMRVNSGVGKIMWGNRGISGCCGSGFPLSAWFCQIVIDCFLVPAE